MPTTIKNEKDAEQYNNIRYNWKWPIITEIVLTVWHVSFKLYLMHIILYTFVLYAQHYIMCMFPWSIIVRFTRDVFLFCFPLQFQSSFLWERNLLCLALSGGSGKPPAFASAWFTFVRWLAVARAHSQVFPPWALHIARLHIFKHVPFWREMSRCQRRALWHRGLANWLAALNDNLEAISGGKR